MFRSARLEGDSRPKPTVSENGLSQGCFFRTLSEFSVDRCSDFCVSVCHRGCSQRYRTGLLRASIAAIMPISFCSHTESFVGLSSLSRTKFPPSIISLPRRSRMLRIDYSRTEPTKKRLLYAFCRHIESIFSLVVLLLR